MSEWAMNIVKKVMTPVAIEELFLSQVKRQIDESNADGKPMLPLWADRVGFKVGPRGGIKMVNSPLVRVPRAKRAGKAKKMIRQLRAVKGSLRKISNKIIKALKVQAASLSKSPSRTPSGQSRTMPGSKKIKAPKPGKIFYSYRRGGKPLLDTRAGYAAITTTAHMLWPYFTVEVEAPNYMVAQHGGFKTVGPNFIPLTRKARVSHTKGADPRTEGLKRGIDFWVFRKGVRVPPRPFAKLGPHYMRRLARSIFLAARAMNNG